jgi:hypothetical protein
MTHPACLTLHSQVSSQDAPKYTKYVLKYTPRHDPKVAPTCTRWHTTSLLDCTLPSTLLRCSQVHGVCSQVHSQACSQGCFHLHSMAPNQLAWLYTAKPALKKLSRTLPSTLSSTLPIALDGALPAYLALRSQVRFQDGRHSQSHLTIYSHVPSCMLYPEAC